MHFNDLAVLNTDRGVVWGEIVISDFSNQEAAGIIQDFSRFKVRSIVVLKIHGYPDSRLADFIPVLRVIVAALIKDTGFVRDQVKAIFIQMLNDTCVLLNTYNNVIIRILNNDCVIESGLAPLSIMLCKGFLYENQDD